MHRPPPTNEAHSIPPLSSSPAALALRLEEASARLEHHEEDLSALQDLERNFRADLDDSARELRVGIAQLERLPAQFGALSLTVDPLQGHVDELSA